MDVIRSILKIYPDYECTVRDNNYYTVEIAQGESRPLPSLSELQNAWALVQAEELVQAEVENIKDSLRNALAWEFRMILAVWDVGVAKGLWSASDITDTELKQKVADWIVKLDRLTQLGE